MVHILDGWMLSCRLKSGKFYMVFVTKEDLVQQFVDGCTKMGVQSYIEKVENLDVEI